MFDDLIKGIAVLLVASWCFIWWFMGIVAHKKKPRSQDQTLQVKIKRYTRFIFPLFVILQFGGLQVLPFNYNFNVQLSGLFILIVGFCIGIFARFELGNNWSHAYEYQIKKEQELVTSGIYKYIRHPIYTAVLFLVVGIELILQSYLFIVAFVLFTLLSYYQGKSEEKLLRNHYGKQYEVYSERSKMLFPFIY
jgi:protein-S-isoprenylcysteine O-methyltransferase Ste14